jgi:DNA-binding response OmpR family regulator
MKKKAKKVLIVEDSKLTRIQMSEALVNEGFEVIGAERGAELLDSKKFNPSNETTGLLDLVVPDLFVLDVGLEDMNGIDVLIKLKEHHIFKDIPVIINSSHHDRDTIINAISAGAVDYVVKSGNYLPILVAKVRQIFKKELSSFETTLQSEFEWIKFGNKEMALAFISIHNTSNNNPLSSQEFVDLVIFLQKNTKHYDWIFPLDDYNVAVVLPLVTIQDIVKIKERLHEEIKSFIKDIKVPVDVQIGFSHYPTNASTVQELINVAEGQITRVNASSV